MRYVLTNVIWNDLGPRVVAAKRSRAGSRPYLPDRLFLEAILYRARTGVAWRNLPAEFGDWNAVYQRAKRWRLTGTWNRLFSELPTDSPVQEVRRLFLEPSTVPAHPDAAGPNENVTEAEGALDRSRGGFSTEGHLLAADEGTPVAVLRLPEQANDARPFNALFDVAAAQTASAREVQVRGLHGYGPHSPDADQLPVYGETG
jgi:transposase